MRVPSLRYSPGQQDDSSIYKVETSLERQKHFSHFEDRQLHFLVTSMFLYACESWTHTVEVQRRIRAMEKRCYRKILRISYRNHVTNEEVRAKIQQEIGSHADLTILDKTILQGTVKGGRRQRRLNKKWKKP